jgi:hypothetical protein
MITMGKLILSMTFLSCLGLAQGVFAAPVDDFQTALMSARQHLVDMIGAPNAAAQDQHHAALTQASEQADAAIAAALGDPATSKEQKAKWETLQKTWEDFKKTREGEIVPKVRAGEVDAAKAIAQGVQAERLATMKSLLGELGAK